MTLSDTFPENINVHSLKTTFCMFVKDASVMTQRFILTLPTVSNNRP